MDRHGTFPIEKGEQLQVLADIIARINKVVVKGQDSAIFSITLNINLAIGREVPGMFPAIDPGDIEALTGPLDRREAPRPGEGLLLSPGLLDRHYAPRGTVRLFASAERPALVEELGRLDAGGRIIGGMLLGEDLPGRHMLRMPDDPAGYARALYAALHQLDDLGCDLILVEEVPDEILWAGVRDRLVRAATAASG